MTGLVNLITQHSEKLNILPIIVVMNIIITILIHFLTKRKFIKYIPSLAIGIGALVLLLNALKIFTTERGLDLSWIAVFLGTAALVGLFTCFILDLATSIVRSTKTEEAQQSKAVKKTKAKTADPIKEVKATKTVKETAEKPRVARKASKTRKPKENSSKYSTRKVSKDEIEKVRASRVKKLDEDVKTLTFESDSE